jgi:uncharacterized protein (TIGR03083 family)
MYYTVSGGPPMSEEIIDTRALFSEITEKLLSLLPSLGPEEWNAPTCYSRWKVKDIAAHLLQTGAGRLSRQRDSWPSGEALPSVDFNTLTDFILQSNEDWTSMLRDVSPAVLLDMISTTETQLAAFISSQELSGRAFFPVAWAGENGDLNWLDLAREYTERWHHQQQIREAVNVPGIMTPRYLPPVIGTLIHAVPFWYESVEAEPGIRIQIDITGDSGTCRILEKREEGWQLTLNGLDRYDEKISLTDDTAWRFFMRSITREEAAPLIQFSSDSHLCMGFLNVKAVMMKDS